MVQVVPDKRKVFYQPFFGVKKMKRYLIATGTITFAIKGRDALRRKGYKAGVEKINSGKNNNGCGYAIATSGDLSSIERILQDNGIKILEITER